jgi:molecular chaperone GrpE
MYLQCNFAQIFDSMEENTMTNNQENVQDQDLVMNINSDSDVPGDTHLQEPLGDDNELEKVKEELEVQKDKYIRLFAEFDNYKKRTAKEYIELRETAGKDILISLLDVLDDVERAQKQMDATEDLAQIKEGVQLVFNKFKNTMQSKGIKTMDSIGTEFNTDLHEAITEIPAPVDDMKGKVIDEVMKGYYLREKVLRFAKVVVGN